MIHYNKWCRNNLGDVRKEGRTQVDLCQQDAQNDPRKDVIFLVGTSGTKINTSDTLLNKKVAGRIFSAKETG